MQKKGILPILLAMTLTVSSLTGCSGSDQEAQVTSSAGQEQQDTQKALQGHNEDVTANLGVWGRAMGSVLISMNEGSPYYFGGYEETEANRKAAADILNSSWNISNRKELLGQIYELITEGSRKEYRQEAAQMNRLSDKKLKKVMSQLSGSLLIHYQQIQRNWQTWGRDGLLAWDMCRVSHLVQWGLIAEYLTLDEAQALIEPAARRLQEKFQSWEQVITNWLDGYALYAVIDTEQPDNDYQKRKEVYEKLVEQQKQAGVLYDDDLFQEEIVPLTNCTYKTLFQELKKTQKKSGHKNKKGKKQSQKNDE